MLTWALYIFFRYSAQLKEIETEKSTLVKQIETRGALIKEKDLKITQHQEEVCIYLFIVMQDQFYI